MKKMMGPQDSRKVVGGTISTGEEMTQLAVTEAADFRTDFPLFFRRSGVLQDRRLKYRPVPEVFALLAKCHEAGQGREITAALRIMREQFEARATYQEIASAAWLHGRILAVLLIAAGFAFALGPSNSRAPMFVAPCLCFAIAILAGQIRLLRGRRVAALYQAERQRIEEQAVYVIGQYAGDEFLPHRLYEDDVERLEELARRYPNLRFIAKTWRGHFRGLS